MSLQAVELRSADEVRAHAASVRAKMRAGYSPSQVFLDASDLQKKLAVTAAERDEFRSKCAELQAAYDRLLMTSTSAAASVKSASPSIKRGVGVKEVLRVVADLYRVATHEIIDRNTYGYMIEPRDVSIYLLRIIKGMSLNAVGEAIGGRHHTTCLHAFNKVALRRRGDAAFDQKIMSLIAVLDGAKDAKA